MLLGLCDPSLQRDGKCRSSTTFSCSPVSGDVVFNDRCNGLLAGYFVLEFSF